jgi:hypothetical protein
VNGLARKKWWLLTALLVTAALAAGFFWPRRWLEGPSLCQMRMVVGYPCPGCGMTRSIASLLHGEVAVSVRMHAFGPVLVLFAGWVWLRSVRALLSPDPRPLDLTRPAWTAGLIAFIVLYVAYWIARLATDSVPA